MFRRISLFDSSPPAASVSVSRPKVSPPRVHSSSLNGGVCSSPVVIPNGGTPEIARLPPKTSPIAIKNNRNVNGIAAARLPPTTPSPKDHKPLRTQRHSTGSTPNPSLLQQQVHAAQVYLSSNRNSFVLQQPGSNESSATRRAQYQAARSISNPVSPSQPPCPLSSSLPTGSSFKYHPGVRPSASWYARFSYSLRRNMFRRSTSSINNNVIWQMFISVLLTYFISHPPFESPRGKSDLRPLDWHPNLHQFKSVHFHLVLSYSSSICQRLKY